MLHFVPIRDIQTPGLEPYTKYSELELRRLYEPNGGLFIAESPKVVSRALDAGCLPTSLLLEEGQVHGESREVLARCALAAGERDLPAFVGPYAALTKLTGYALTRGLLCAMRRPPLVPVEDLLAGRGSPGQASASSGTGTPAHGSGTLATGAPEPEKASSGACLQAGMPGRGRFGNQSGWDRALSPPRRIAVLEKVANPTNVGAIFRNAAALGIDAVILTDGCSDPLYRRALRVSMGTALQLPWTWFGRSMEDWKRDGLRALREHGFATVAMALREDAWVMSDWRGLSGPRMPSGTGKVAILLGAEGDGLCPETIAGADIVARIPMQRGVDSLNVAAASAIAFYVLGGPGATAL